MFLLYVDESGTPQDLSEKYFIIAGVAIYENQAYYLSQAFDKIQEKWFPQASTSIEFHAAKIRNGNGEPWHSLTRETRKNILIDLYDEIIKVTPKGLSLFGIAIHKSDFSGEDIVEKSFQELCGHFDAYIDKVNLELANDNSKQKNRGMMILDSSKYKGQLDKMLLAYRNHGGTKFGRVKNFVDAPSFADSTTTRLLQAADIVSYAIYRRYENSDTLFLDKILPRFCQKENKIHGLMHLVANYRQCSCPACLSRKDN